MSLLCLCGLMEECYFFWPKELLFFGGIGITWLLLCNKPLMNLLECESAFEDTL